MEQQLKARILLISADKHIFKRDKQYIHCIVLYRVSMIMEFVKTTNVLLGQNIKAKYYYHSLIILRKL